MKAHVFIALIKLNPLLRDSTNAHENLKAFYYGYMVCVTYSSAVEENGAAHETNIPALI